MIRAPGSREGAPGAGLPASDKAGQNGGEFLGIWCPEPGYIRVLCFEPDALIPFPLTDVAGWFKQSTERVYSGTAPVAEMEISSRLAAGTHRLEFSPQLRCLDELLLISSYPARSKDDPACAIFVLRPGLGTLEVLPQRWFTASRYDIGYQWITRVARDPVSQRIVGEGFRIRAFELNEDGTDIARWLG